MSLTVNDLRRATRESAPGPYRRGKGQHLPQRSSGARRRAGKKAAATAYPKELASVGVPPPLPKPKDVKARSKDANMAAALALLDDDGSDVGHDADEENDAAASGSNAVATGSNAVLCNGRTNLPPTTPDDLPSDAAHTISSTEQTLAVKTTNEANDDDDDDGGDGPAEIALPGYNIPVKHLRNLEHSGRGDQEDEWRAQNHHLLLGQGAAKGSRADAGCDIPMLRTSSSFVPSVCLDPDLPPLAAEHPARVWNSMLHALAPDLQPIIRWAYDDVMVSGEWTYVARMTLILPPTHPAILAHPAAAALPKNRYLPAYQAAMEALGGVKSWVGPPRKLKADAQNTTITMCIAENALDWVLAPVMVPVPEEYEPSPAEKLLQDLEALGADPASGISASMEVEHDDAVDVYGCLLTIRGGGCMPGDEPQVQRYSVECVHPTPEAAQDAVCQRALDLNVRGFIDWLQGSSITDAESSCATRGARSEATNTPEDNHHGKDVKPFTVTHDGDEIDWQVQLAYFCHISALAPPKYSQTTVRRAGLPTLFNGKVTVDGEVFESESSHDNLGVARQAVARYVFEEHFGQEAVRDVPSAFGR